MTDPYGKIDQAKLAKLAEVSVQVGLNLQPGQDLVLTAPTTALPLVRQVVAAAYKAGANIVTPILSDDAITLARYESADDASFDCAPNWLYNGMAEAYGNNAARMAISAENPALLSGQDPAKVARAGKANSLAYKPALDHIVNFNINWNITAFPGLAWAKLVFPDLPDDEAVFQLSEAIFAASRINEPDPVAAWAAHNANLKSRTDYLNDQRFHALHYTGPGTDLTIGLADGHEWAGGASDAKNGITCNPNIPTEEVFTTPHAMRVDGYVRATKPLAHQGAVIEDIEVKFVDGRIIEASASKGEAAFIKLLDSDDGARRIGEVALVPHGSPISQSGVLFYNTLFDENAASHIALGQCYTDCFVGGADLSKDQIKAQGGNSSIIHVDWMIGSAEINIDGLDSNGKRTPLFRAGEWAV
ncbi:MAG: aminopeptidase [Rhodobacteraceae bacterium]|nr:aminopeptidase [Paracoccaceae bacterium]